jgi:hypothetical protein
MPSCLPKIREMRKKKWLDSYRKTFNKAAACKAVKANRSTIWRWIQDDSEFAELVREVEESMLDTAESELMKLVRSGDFKAVKFLLVTKGRSRGYGEKLQIEKTTKHETIDTKRLELILMKDSTRKALEVIASDSLDIEIKDHDRH